MCVSNGGEEGGFEVFVLIRVLGVTGVLIFLVLAPIFHFHFYD